VEETRKAAEEIHSIRETVQNRKLNAERAIFEERNAANKTWMVRES